MFSRNSTNNVTTTVPDRKEYKSTVTYRGVKNSTVKLVKNVKNKVTALHSTMTSRSTLQPLENCSTPVALETTVRKSKRQSGNLFGGAENGTYRNLRKEIDTPMTPDMPDTPMTPADDLFEYRTEGRFRRLVRERASKVLARSRIHKIQSPRVISHTPRRRRQITDDVNRLADNIRLLNKRVMNKNYTPIDTPRRK